MMKKTLTVNLGGSVFNIDEDAYLLLDKYLSNLRIHFQKEEGSDEIMDDFEARIAELLNDRLRLGYEVITIAHIEDIIKRMGKPEEIFEDEKSSEKEEQEQAETQNQEIHTNKKRLMRDPDNRILGGVAGGFAAYMNWDPTALRIILFLLIFVYGVTIPIYFLLWIIIPMAHTATEKLEMRGQSVTIENIGKTVTDGFEKVCKDTNDFINSGKPRSFIQRLGDAFVQIVGFSLKVILVLIGICTLPIFAIIIFIFAVITFALLAGGAGAIYNLFPAFGAEFITNPPLTSTLIGCVGVILSIGIPTFAIIYAICSQFFKMRSLSKLAKWILTILWIASVVMCGSYIYQMSMFYGGWHNYLNNFFG